MVVQFYFEQTLQLWILLFHQITTGASSAHTKTQFEEFGPLSRHGRMPGWCEDCSRFGGATRGHVARIQTLGTPSSVLISRSLNFKGNRQNCVSGPRKSPQSMSVRAITEVASEEGYEGSPSAEEMLRKADSYFATDTRPIILFDGVCNFCNAGVNFVLDNDPEGRLRMAALQSEAGKALLLRSGRSSDNISSLVLVEKDGSYIKSEGVLRSAKYLGNLLPPLSSFGLLLPLFFRDFVYDNVADNRYSIFGRRNVCRVSDERFNDRFVM